MPYTGSGEQHGHLATECAAAYYKYRGGRESLLTLGPYACDIS